LDPPDLLGGRGAGRLTGGADPPARLWLLIGGGPADEGAGAGGGGAGDAARGRGPVPADRPAPRDQPFADAAAEPADPFGSFGPLTPLEPDLGGRSSGGATRPLVPSASVTFLARAGPVAPLTPPLTRPEPSLASPSPSAGGGVVGRSRDA
jgi:hypothetical protein